MILIRQNQMATWTIVGTNLDPSFIRMHMEVVYNDLVGRWGCGKEREGSSRHTRAMSTFDGAFYSCFPMSLLGRRDSVWGGRRAHGGQEAMV